MDFPTREKAGSGRTFAGKDFIMNLKSNGFKSSGPGRNRGVVLEHARVPFVGARVKRWSPGHGDNGLQGTIVGFTLPGDPNPRHEAWEAVIMWPGRRKTKEYVTY